MLELPLELQNLIKTGVEIGVVFLLTELAKAGFDFQGYRAQVVAAIFSAAIVVVNYFLGLVPAGYEGIAAALLNLVVVLLGAFGLYKAYRTFRPK
jgi:uncharacterized membrane protein